MHACNNNWFLEKWDNEIEGDMGGVCGKTWGRKWKKEIELNYYLKINKQKILEEIH